MIRPLQSKLPDRPKAPAMHAASRPPWRGYAAALGVVCIWTGFILISRWGGKSPLTGYDVLALRLGAASLLLLPFCRDLPRTVWRERRLWTLAAIGGVLYGVVVYTALQIRPGGARRHSAAGHAAVLVTALLVAGAGRTPHPQPADRPGWHRLGRAVWRCRCCKPATGARCRATR